MEKNKFLVVRLTNKVKLQQYWSVFEPIITGSGILTAFLKDMERIAFLKDRYGENNGPLQRCLDSVFKGHGENSRLKDRDGESNGTLQS